MAIAALKPNQLNVDVRQLNAVFLSMMIGSPTFRICSVNANNIPEAVVAKINLAVERNNGTWH